MLTSAEPKVLTPKDLYRNEIARRTEWERDFADKKRMLGGGDWQTKELAEEKKQREAFDKTATWKPGMP